MSLSWWQSLVVEETGGVQGREEEEDGAAAYLNVDLGSVMREAHVAGLR